ncbi:MAG: DUF167 domain-containing protein [bacterium]
MLTQAVLKYKEDGEIYLRIKARPGAATTEVKGLLETPDGDTYKIDLAAAPEQGKANLELIKYLAVWFEVAKANITVLSGAGDKFKLIKIVK